MTIEFKTGNILDAEETLICQQVNYQKVMGGGLAKQIKNKWPEIYKEYCECIDEYSWELMKEIGLYQMILTSDDHLIGNIFGQKFYGNNGVYTDYIALKNSLDHIKRDAESLKFSIALPYKIGCGLAGGDWNIVYKIIQDIFENSEIKVVIYKLEGVE